MKKKDLEIRLQSLELFDNPDPKLEQYPTPATITADIIYWAFVNGDVMDMKVCDLGCGTGMFSVGAYLAGASEVVGFDISRSALDVAERNSKKLDCEIKYVETDIRNVTEKCDTVLMNPPFGSQKKHADRPFLEKAMEISDSVYSIHMLCTLPFIQETAESRGRQVVSHKIYKYDIPHTFSFHSKTKQSVDIVAVNIR